MISYQYDALNRLISKSSYLSQSQTTPPETTRYSYDTLAHYGKGRLTAVDTPTYRESFSYRPNGASLWKNRRFGDNAKIDLVNHFAYRADGRLLSVSSVNRIEKSYQYRHDNTLKTVTLKDIKRRRLGSASFDPLTSLGKPTSIHTVDKSDSTYSYDPGGRLRKLTVANPKHSKPFLHLQYAWNGANKLLSITDVLGGSRTEKYSDHIQAFYNYRGELSRAMGPYGSLSYEYDKSGSLIHQDNYRYEYDSKNPHQVTRIMVDCHHYSELSRTCTNGTEYARLFYDDIGNLIKKTVGNDNWEYHYDVENQLKEVIKNSIVVNRFNYDHRGNRTEKTDYDEQGTLQRTTTYVTNRAEEQELLVESENNLLIKDTANSRFYEILTKPNGEKLHTHYLSGSIGSLAAITGLSATEKTGTSPPPETLQPGINGVGVPDDEAVFYFYRNHLGSNILVTNQKGDSFNNVTYRPYGSIDAENSRGVDNFRPKFSDKEWDTHSDLYYFGARYYSPEIGRFITPDPAHVFNSPYIYTEGDPLTEIDPDGQGPELLAGGLGIIGAGLLGYMGYKLIKASIDRNSDDSSSNECGNSFTANTKVFTQYGKKKIKNIEPGIQVWGLNESTQQTDLYDVLDVSNRETNTLITINIGDVLIEATPEHPFYVLKKGWVKAGDLMTGDQLKTLDSKKRFVKSIDRRYVSTRVYNFEVDNVHNYYVSDGEVLVHNAPIGCGPEVRGPRRSITRRNRASEVHRDNIINHPRQRRRVDRNLHFSYYHQRNLFMPGQWTQRSIAARGAAQSFTRYENEQIDLFGRLYGCHSCGSRNSGTAVIPIISPRIISQSVLSIVDSVRGIIRYWANNDCILTVGDAR